MRSYALWKKEQLPSHTERSHQQKKGEKARSELANEGEEEDGEKKSSIIIARHVLPRGMRMGKWENATLMHFFPPESWMRIKTMLAVRKKMHSTQRLRKAFPQVSSLSIWIWNDHLDQRSVINTCLYCD